MTTTPTLHGFLRPGYSSQRETQNARVLSMADGSLLYVYERVDANGTTLMATPVIFNGHDTSFGREFTISGTPDYKYLSGLASLPDGGFVVLYSGARQPNGLVVVTVERYNPLGVLVFTDHIIAADGIQELTVNSSGDYTVAFEAVVQGGPDVHAFQYRFAGNTRSFEQSFTAQNSHGDGDNDYVHGIANFSNGDLLCLSSEGDKTPVLGTIYEIAELRITSPSGAPIGSHVQIAGSSPDDEAYARDLAMLTGDRFVAVCQIRNKSADTFYYEFRLGSRSGASALTLGPPVKITPTFDFSLGRAGNVVSVVGLKDGGFYIAWADPKTRNLVGTRYSTTGSVIGEAASVVGTNVLLGSSIDLALTTDGRIVVTWKHQTVVGAAPSGFSSAVIDPRDNVIVGDDRSETITAQTTTSYIYGEGGDDAIYGSSYVDFLNGGFGSDTIYGSLGGDQIHGNEGRDHLYGEYGDDSLFGDDGDDFLSGGFGNDLLDGGAGADLMEGNDGNDTFIVDNSSDTVKELANEGTDIILSTVTYALSANVENLTLTGTLSINGTGNELKNVLIGNSAANALDGGLGADTMAGGDGGDTYIIDDVGDVVIEGAKRGTDLVVSSISYALPVNVEYLRLTGTANINGTGNDLNNQIVGNAGNNILDGGLGSDTLTGGAGNDVFVVDVASDVVIETATGGVDRVQSSKINLNLAAYANVENLALSGSLALTATGNAGANGIDGLSNSAANVLIGLGGNDTYYVGTGDTVIEAVDGGIDTVVSSQKSLSLKTFANVERASLFGAAALNLTGNDTANVLTGNDGNNLIDGGGGADTLNGGLGSDTLTGGAGADVFLFNTALSASNVDTITDFLAVDDTIRLENAVFKAFAAVASNTAISAVNLRAGVGITSAGDANDFILYNTSTGDLYYDPDGNAAGAATKFATLSTKPTLTAADFVVV